MCILTGIKTALLLVFLTFLVIGIESHSGDAESSEHDAERTRSIRLANQQRLGKLNADFWYERGVRTLKKHWRDLANAGFPALDKNRRVRNIILFIGDGHGPVSVTATRLYKQEFSKSSFHENKLVMDSFPFSGHSKTYNLDFVIPDSAATATAYHSASKTLYGSVGIDVTGDLDCKNDDGFLSSIAHWAKDAGKDAGLVTTTSITHASPAPLYAHTPHRSHHSNDTVGMFRFPNCVDISQQFLQNGRHLKVAMGGGEDYFIPDTMTGSFGKGTGNRKDDRNLIQEWLDDRSQGGLKPTYATNITQLQSVDPKNTHYLLGLFDRRSLPYMDDVPDSSIPTLAQMTKKAIEVLNENPSGYYLFVEAGKIDLGHHAGVARKALREGLEMDKALEQVLNMVDLRETLVVVSADHSHTLTLGGYFKPGDSVLGLSSGRANDKKNYTLLQYANGPGAKLRGSRPDVTQDEAVAHRYRQQALVLLDTETHGAEDVGVYATGPYAELFSGVYEQNYIALAMACAGGLQEGLPGNLADSMRDMCPEPWQRSSS